jgi:hypothetical protein
VSESAPAATSRWAAAWLDAVAFAGGLAVAWWQGWNTTDLVWSLWLSSLVVGYAIIVWEISEPLRDAIAGLESDRGEVALWAKLAVGSVYALGTLVTLAFFTVHFGGFHFVHSVFLNVFFPLDGHAPHDIPKLATYLEVLRRYWWFLPVAAIAERAAFRAKPDESDTAATPEAIARRKSVKNSLADPYLNVMRMHLLIFFFAFAHFAKLESFAVYAVVYAVYFFPWRLLRPAAARS